MCEENGPFELYHIERCTDPACQGSHASNLYENRHGMNRRKYLIYQNSIETNDGISMWNSSTLTTFCSIAGENDLMMIDYPVRPKSIKDNNVFVTKVPRPKKLNSAFKSLNEESVGDEDQSFTRLNSSGTVRVTRVKSSSKDKSVTMNDQSLREKRESAIEEAVNVVRVTRVPSIPVATEEIRRLSIIEDTIRLDENDETILRNSVSKKDKERVRVKRIKSSHRTSAIETRPSQIDTIELSPLTGQNSSEILPSVRVERIRTAKKKLKSAKNTMPFESILETECDKTNDLQRLEIDFGVTVERVPREKSSKSVK